jgi:transposase-like protein
MKQPLSILSIAEKITTEAEAYLFLEGLRWADGVVCPHCGCTGRCFYLNPDNGTSRKTTRGPMSQRRVWKCGDCRKQFSVLTGTIFHGTKISIRKWIFVIFEMCSSKNGVAAREIERKYELTAKTAWFMLHRIREAMKREPLAGLLRGTIISDETWYGGKPSNRHADKTHPGHGNTDKQPILALVDFETREVRSRVVPNVTGQTLAQAMSDEVDIKGSQLWSDEHSGYRTLGNEFNEHHTVNHSANQYKNRGATTNAAEGYFSQLKRSLDGTHHHVSTVHLDRYLAQFDFLFTYCKETDTERMLKVIDRTGGRRLTYKPLTAGE